MQSMDELIAGFAEYLKSTGMNMNEEPQLCVTCKKPVEPVTFKTSYGTQTETPAECASCHAAWLFNEHVARSLLPEKYRIEAEELKRTPIVKLRPLVEHVISGKSVFLCGPVGPGKSVLAAQVLMGVMRKAQHQGLWLAENDIPPIFWGNSKNGSNPAEKLLLLAKENRYIVIDDLGLNESISRAVDGFIDWMYSKRMPAIVTTNLSMDTLYQSEQYRRSASRLQQMTGPEGIIMLPNVDRRLDQQTRYTAETSRQRGK